MRLFISYARVDLSFCEELIKLLAPSHEIWYDQRLHVGAKWWDVICSKLEWCEGFVYLISADSLKSSYCQEELKIAIGSGKPIFPILIQPRLFIPDHLTDYQYVDMGSGVTPDSIARLLHAITEAERNLSKSAPLSQAIKPLPAKVVSTVEEVESATSTTVNGSMATSDLPQTPPGELEAQSIDIIDKINKALAERHYDEAVFLIKNAKKNGFVSSFLHLEDLLQQAEKLLQEQAYLRSARREYGPIYALSKNPLFIEQACSAFEKFRQRYPDYDPQNLAALCVSNLMPQLEWCEIPEGDILMRINGRDVYYHVDSFYISKYPITNDQFQTFIDAEDGYSNDQWWNFLPEAAEWHKSHPEPLPVEFRWGNHPRQNVCWYEAVAFCRWLSRKLKRRILLPTEMQWQRAAQGDDNRLYPWGATFKKGYCNTRESQLRTTTSVDRYPENESPFGVRDMIGNVWEWCLNTEFKPGKKKRKKESGAPRAVRGGSYISDKKRCTSVFPFYLNPQYRYNTIGFRIVYTEPKE